MTTVNHVEIIKKHNSDNIDLKSLSLLYFVATSVIDRLLLHWFCDGQPSNKDQK